MFRNRTWAQQCGTFFGFGQSSSGYETWGTSFAVVSELVSGMGLATLATLASRAGLVSTGRPAWEALAARATAARTEASFILGGRW